MPYLERLDVVSDDKTNIQSKNIKLQKINHINTTSNYEITYLVGKMTTSLLHHSLKLYSNLLFTKKVAYIFFVVILFAYNSFSQSLISQNEVKNFSRNEYGAGTQNWAITQDKYNRIYIANNEGLLVFNGTNWQVFPLPNKTILRSIKFGADGKLFAGAQDELGYFAPDDAGRLRYTSLTNLLPNKEKKLNDIWQIETTDNEVFFRTNTTIFKLGNEKFSIYPTQSSWLSLHKYQQKLLAHDEKLGILVYDKGSWKTFIRNEILPVGFYITAIVPYKNDTSLVSTKSNGLYLLTQNKLLPFTVKSTNFNSTQHFTSLAIINDSNFLVGSYYNGVFQITNKGQVIENISTKNGLMNNTIRNLFADSSNNIWMCLDNGVANYSYNNAIKHINPTSFNNGAGYSVKLWNNELYFALSTGLQWLPVLNFTNLSAINIEPNTIKVGLSWNLSIVNNQLFVGRDDGLWKINNHLSTPISTNSGFWICTPIPNTTPFKMIGGNYSGVRIYETGLNNNFIDKGSVEKFTESSRYVETDENNIWISHPYRGVYKINIENYVVTLYNQKKGLPSDLDNHVFRIKNKILFATTQGIFEYDFLKDEIIPSKEYANLFGKIPVRYLKEDEKGNIWFVKDKMVGVADYSTNTPTIHYIPELTNKIISGFENIFPYNLNNVFIGAESGFYLINYENYRQNLKPFKVYITSAKTIGTIDSVLFGGFLGSDGKNNTTISLPYKYNSVHFACAATIFKPNSNIEFSYFLGGFDNNWSTWNKNPEKDYTNLPPGTYLLKIKARTSPSQQSEVYEYTFKINNPWYKTVWAYILYMLTLCSIIYTIHKYQKNRIRKEQEVKTLSLQLKYEEEQRQFSYQHQIELQKTEKEIIRLKNENLESEIEYQNAELGSIAMNLVQKKEFLLKIVNELNKIYKPGKENIEPTEIKKILRSINSEEKLDDEWQQFSVHFNKVHSNFLLTLKNKYPILNGHDLKLCAYLRMNLSSKEMAHLMSISLRGVEIGRYRLRKKLQLQLKEDLFQFLMQIESIEKK